MRIVHNPEHHRHDARHGMYRGRLACVVEALRQRPVGVLSGPGAVAGTSAPGMGTSVVDVLPGFIDHAPTP